MAAIYFFDLLNVPTQVEQAEMNGISWKVPDVSLAETPTIKETIAAIQRLKKGKASGPDGIEAEILMSLDSRSHQCTNIT